MLQITPHSIPAENEALSEKLADTAVIFSCDEQFAPLAKGLVLSLIASGAKINIFCIDIGLSGQSRSWLEERGIQLITFGWQDLFKINKHFKSGQYRLAQYVRPFLPQLIKDYEYYIWLDADTWLQDPNALLVLKSAVATSAKWDIAIAPRLTFPTASSETIGKGL